MIDDDVPAGVRGAPLIESAVSFVSTEWRPRILAPQWVAAGAVESMYEQIAREFFEEAPGR